MPTNEVLKNKAHWVEVLFVRVAAAEEFLLIFLLLGASYDSKLTRSMIFLFSSSPSTACFLPQHGF